MYSNNYNVYTTYDLRNEKHNYRMGLETLIKQPDVNITFLKGDDRSSDRLTSDDVPEANAILFTSESDQIPSATLDELDGLEIIGRWGAGFDNLDLDLLSDYGIVGVHAPQGPTKSVAQATLCMLLGVSHNIPNHDKEFIDTAMEGRLNRMGKELFGRTLGVIGVGQIGKTIIELVEPFSMDIQVYDPYLPTEEAQELGVRLVEFEELLRTSDFISLHVPLTDETRGLLGEKEFKLMKKDAYLINTTRGGIYRDADLARAIQNDWIAGAAVDVYEDEPDVSESNNPLPSLDNCWTWPHVAGITLDSMNRIGNILAESILRMKENDLPNNILNPDVFDESVPDDHLSPSFKN